MQQPPRFRSQAFAMFRPDTLEEIPRTYSWFAEMRTQDPIFYDEKTHLWQVFRYEDVLTVLTDYSRFSSQISKVTGSFLKDPKDTLIAKDPPDHRKLRNLVNQAFTPRAVARLSDRITQITQDLLDRVRLQGKMDIISDIAFPLPAKIIAEMLGVPQEDWNIFQHWAHVDSTDPALARQEAGWSMSEEMFDYFSELLEERRHAPREDLISTLCTAEVDGERLSEFELVSFCTLLLAAGHETMKNLIANAMVCLTEYPDRIERLIREPTLMPLAIEEILRYLPPIWFLFRQTKTDVELAGQHIPANQLVLAWIASANRDPAQFLDPEWFDIERHPNHHLAFGHGIHLCIGAPLGRLEARIALPMMLQQLRDLREVEGFPITIRTEIVFVIR